jgi:hypothetical protein
VPSEQILVELWGEDSPPSARELGEEVIADKDLVIGKATADTKPTRLTQIAAGFTGNAPLWAYVLSEAQVTSWRNAGRGARRNDIPIKLGPVGGRIVAGVFAALLHGDPTSYLSPSVPFRPITDFARGETFGLAELINVALRPTKKDR